ncbi:MAG: hypothetical protein AAFV45_00375 [Pseudomonadota bacterium]
MRMLTVVLVICGVIAICPARASEPTIEWRVENPFRFFTDAVDTERHRKAARKGGSVLGAERILSQRASFGWAEQIFLKTCWDLFRQDHSACGGLDAYMNPQSHSITASLPGLFGKGANCVWHFSPAGKRSGSWRSISKPCAERIHLDIPFPTGGRLKVSLNGRTVAQTSVQVADLLIVGLGDSYASGDGNPDRPVRWRDDAAAGFGSVQGFDLSGYPRRKPASIVYQGRELIGPSAFWLSQPCHRSLYSHQLRVALKLAFDDPHRAVTFLGLACSGAEITTGLLQAWQGVERFPSGSRRSQIGQVAVAQCAGRAVEQRNYASGFTDGGRVAALDGLMLERCPPKMARKIDLVLMSIGGNDIGFAKLIANAILVDRSPLRRISQLTEQLYTPRDARARFGELRSRLKLLRRALHTHLHIPWKEPHRVILTSYPVIAMKAATGGICGQFNDAGMDGFPGYRLDKRRTSQAERVSAELNQLLKRTAVNYGWTFADTHRMRFAGRGLCAGHEKRNGELENQLRLPRWQNGRWNPHPPSSYRPYAPRQRWMRTSNDAFLTSHIDLSSDLLRERRGAGNYRPSDLLKATTFGGAFHPTAEGQAAMADAVLDQARPIVRNLRTN